MEVLHLRLCGITKHEHTWTVKSLHNTKGMSHTNYGLNKYNTKNINNRM